jgi:hypothetical protein
MEVYEAAEILLKAVHDDINGTIVFSDFVAHQTKGLNEITSAELYGIYNKALLVLLDEGLCHRGHDPDIIELGQKGIESKGDYKKHLKKRNTRNTLEKIRRILPIFTFIFAVIGFYLTYLRKTNNDRKNKASIAQHRKDSILHSKSKRQ